MKNLDVLLINPSALTSIYQALSLKYVALEPPIWAALMANYLRKKEKSVAILDCEAELLTVEESAKKIADYQPKLVAIVVYGQQPSASTQNMYGASLLCTEIKKLYPNQKVILVGGHVSALPKKTMLEEKCDFVSFGEGPKTLLGLLQCSDLENTSQLAQVEGLWYRNEEGVPVFSKPAAKISQKDLADELPGMAFDLLPMKKYRAHNWHAMSNNNERQPYASVYTSLGCPFKCTFCCINAPFGGSSFRYWEPQFMIKQFDILAQDYGVKNVKIADEMFVLKDSHFLELCKLLKERNYGFNIWAYSRIDTVKPHHIEALKDAGVNWIVLGIESHSKFVRDGVEKGRFTDVQIPEVVKSFQDGGINVMGNYIFGLPDDNFESMQNTLDMALELNTEWANFYSAMAYPGSQLYDMAIENNWELPQQWVGFSQHALETLPLPTKFISAGEVLAFRDKAWEIYFRDPNYLALVKSKFGQEAYDHIVQMTNVKLDRKFAKHLNNGFPKLRHSAESQNVFL